MKIKKLHFCITVIVILNLLYLTGCQNLVLNKSDSSEINSSSIVETRAFIFEDSIITGKAEAAPLLLGLVAAVAPVIIEKGIDFIGNQLKQASEAKEIVIVASANSDGFFYVQNDNSIICKNAYIVIVKGRFGKNNDRKIETDDKFWKSETGQAALRRMKLIEIPDFLYEGKFEYKISENSFKIVSSYLEYKKPFEKSIGQKRDLLLTFLFQKPFKTKADDKTESFALGTIKFEDIKLPIKLEFEELRDKESEWLPMPNLPDELKKSARIENDLFVYTLVASITESKDANLYLKLLSDVFEGSKENVKKVVIELIPKTENK